MGEATRRPAGRTRTVKQAAGGQRQTRTKAQRIFRLLREAYGPRENNSDDDPLGGLIGTILSQSTSDINSERAYAALRAAYPTWEAVLAAAPAELAEVIRAGGLANLKAQRIQATLAAILEQHGHLDLAPLRDLPLDEARAWLEHLPGVGPKTAACVLLFNLGRPALPVDTHVHRVSRRLGLIGPRVGAAAAHSALQEQLDPAQVYEFHINMITHGRRICHAQRPRCMQCALRDECNYFQGQQGMARA